MLQDRSDSSFGIDYFRQARCHRYGAIEGLIGEMDESHPGYVFKDQQHLVSSTPGAALCDFGKKASKRFLVVNVQSLLFRTIWPWSGKCWGKCRISIGIDFYLALP